MFSLVVKLVLDYSIHDLHHFKKFRLRNVMSPWKKIETTKLQGNNLDLLENLKKIIYDKSLKCASFLHPKAIVISTYLKNLQGTIFKHGCCSSQAYTTQLPPNNHTLPTSISQLGPENGHFLPKTFGKTFTGSYKVRMYGAKFRVLVNLQVVFASPP